jgi:hypothetical protein
MCCLAGLDNSDNVEGFMADKTGVMRLQGPDQLLSGAPYRLSSSASAGKEQLLMQVSFNSCYSNTHN